MDDNSSDFKQLCDLATSLRLEPWTFTDKRTPAFIMNDELRSLLGLDRLWVDKQGTWYYEIMDRPEIFTRLRIHAFSLYQYRKSQVIVCSRAVLPSLTPFTDTKHILLWRNVPGRQDKLDFDFIDYD